MAARFVLIGLEFCMLIRVASGTDEKPMRIRAEDALRNPLVLKNLWKR